MMSRLPSEGSFQYHRAMLSIDASEPNVIEASTSGYGFYYEEVVSAPHGDIRAGLDEIGHIDEKRLRWCYGSFILVDTTIHTVESHSRCRGVVAR